MNFISNIDNLCAQLRSDEIERQVFVDECARLACREVGCSRAGLWVFAQTPSGLVLRCLGMYDARSESMVQVEDRVQQDSDIYFTTLRAQGSVVAVDAANHPATQGFYETGLRPRGVVSLLSVAFSLNGELFGAFTCSQVDHPAHWTRRQLAMLSRIGSRASLALASVSPNQLSTFFGPIQ
jgi:GAF domain-containing protein